MTKSRSQWLLDVRDEEKELTAEEDEEAFWGKGNALHRNCRVNNCTQLSKLRTEHLKWENFCL